MDIRKATERDIQAIHQMAEEIWWPAYRDILSKEQIQFMLEEMYSVKNLKLQMSEGIEFLLVERDQIPVAFAGYSLTEPDKQIYKLHKIYVLPSEQGKGTGKSLIEYISSLIKSQGATILELNVNRANPAKYFYERLGFGIHKTVDIPFHHFVMNDYIMRKSL